MRKDENQMKLFKCYDCGHQFYVSDEDSEDIVCRNCQSDNVSPVNRKPMLMKILAFVAIAAIGFGVALSVMDKETIDKPTGGDGPTGINVPLPIDTLPKVNQALLEIIELSYKAVEHENYVYSFVADCNFKDKDKVNFKYEYQLMEEEEGKIIQKSTDGKFVNLKPTDTESYYFKVTISDGKNTIVTDSKQATGFTPVPVPVPIKPWTKEQLEEAILGQKASMERKFIARSIKISYTNLRPNEGAGPTNLLDVETQVDFGIWSSIKVKSVGYNSRNEISSCEIEVEYP